MKSKFNNSVFFGFYLFADCMNQEPKDSIPAEECDGKFRKLPAFPNVSYSLRRMSPLVGHAMLGGEGGVPCSPC